MQEQRQLDKLEVTAYHEAGHAVMHHLQRVAMKAVTIVPGEESWGRVVTPRFTQKQEKEAYSPSLSFVLRHALTLLAGPVAAAIAQGLGWKDAELELPDEDGTSWAMSDLSNAAIIIEKFTMSPEERDEMLDWLLCRTYLTLTRPYHWAAVEVLTQAILEEHTIKSRRVHRIIREAIIRWGDEERRKWNESRAKRSNRICLQNYPQENLWSN